MSASSKKKLRKEQNAAAMTERQRKQQKEDKKLKAYTISFVIVMVLVVATVLGVVVRAPISGAIDRGTHAVTVNGHELSTTDLSYHYVDTINNYIETIRQNYYGTYGNYWTILLGFDTTKPLNEQSYGDGKGTTWADYFMDRTMDSLKSTYALYDKATEENFKLPEDVQKRLDSFEDDLTLAAKNNQFSSANAYLRQTYGDGANVKTYKEYYRVNTIASAFYSDYAESLEYTDKDYREFEKGKFNDYSTFSFAYYQIKVSDYLTGKGTKDENGKETYTEEQKKAALEAAKADAQKLLDSGAKNVKTLNMAIKSLAINKDKKNVECTENKYYFYEQINSKDMKNWIGNANRVEGDLTSLEVATNKTNDDKSTTRETTGFNIVLFLGRENNSVNLIDVRHILVKFTGGTKGENNETVYSDAEKLKAKEKAQAILDEWKKGDATEDSFAALAKEKSDDTTKTSGGLIERVYLHQMVDNFNDWCFDSSRKTGDTALVETEYGYHVMYFVKAHDITYRDAMIKNDLVKQDSEKWHDDLVEKVELVKVDLSRMEWDFVAGY